MASRQTFKRTMASFAGRRRTSVPWSIDDASTFAAQKKFKLLQLLSNDKKALATGEGYNFLSNLVQFPIHCILLYFVLYFTVF